MKPRTGVSGHGKARGTTAGQRKSAKEKHVKEKFAEARVGGMKIGGMKRGGMKAATAKIRGMKVGTLKASADKPGGSERGSSEHESSEPRRDENRYSERNALWVETQRKRTRKRVTLFLDADVLAWFRAQGRKYQREINRTLRRVMMDERTSGKE